MSKRVISPELREVLREAWAMCGRREEGLRQVAEPVTFEGFMQHVEQRALFAQRAGRLPEGQR